MMQDAQAKYYVGQAWSEIYHLQEAATDPEERETLTGLLEALDNISFAMHLYFEEGIKNVHV